MEAVYEILFDTIGEGLIIVSKEGVIVDANYRAHELFGYNDGNLAGQKVELLLPKSLREKHVKVREEFHASPKNRQMGSGMNLKAIRKDGSDFYVEISLNHFNSKGETFVAALITDISKRVDQEARILELNKNLEKKVKERTKELVKSQELYEAVARNFPNGTINVFDKNLNYVFAEGRELHKAGITSKKLIGTSYLDRLSEEIRPKIKRALENVLKGEKEDFELEFRGGYYHINAVPLRSEGKNIDQILLVERNVTEQKIIEKQQQEALEKEKRLNDMKSRFVSMASHEFRTPLSTVLSSVSLIEKYLEKGQIENTEKHTQRIRNAVKGLTDILNDFLSVDKLENQSAEVKLSTFDYRDYAFEISEEIKSICKKGQILEFSCDGKKTEIESDPKILKNVLYNLLSNAIKYSKEGEKIVFSSKIDEKELTIIVQDFGMGIPKKEQAQLFNRFFRAANVFNIEGTGLGLHIVKKYLEMLNGEISFVSEESVGTTFTIRIPLT